MFTIRVLLTEISSQRMYFSINTSISKLLISVSLHLLKVEMELAIARLNWEQKATWLQKFT